MTTKTHYRVVTPSTFSDINSLPSGKPIATIEEAKVALENWGSVPKKSEYFEKWKESRSKCKIVKVTTIIQDID